MKIFYRTHQFSALLATVLIAGLIHLQAKDDAITQEHFPLDIVEMDRSNTHLLTSYADQIGPVQEAVVAVYTARNVRVSSRMADPREEMLRQFFGIPPTPDTQPQVEEETRRIPSGQGSGVIVSSDGYILTNNHVISDRQGNKVDEVFVTLGDGTELSASIVGFDERTDIAVLKVEADDLPFARMADSDNLRIGDVVFAIGNPLGIGRTVTMGIVSATSRNLNLLGTQGYESFIQTDASINMGNSGGALVDAHGRLIGINTAIVSQSGGNIGIGFAVPVTLARSILISLATEGTVRRGLIGIVPGRIDPTLAESFDLPTTDGAIVNQVTEGLPAANAGIKVGDIILRINDQRIKDADHLRLTVATYRPGTVVQVLLLRDGKEMTIPVELADFDDPQGTGIATLSTILPGVEAQQLNPELRERYQVPPAMQGLVITRVAHDSPFVRSQISEGMVILKINGLDTLTLAEAQDALRTGVNRLYVFQRGAYGFIGVRVNRG